MRTLLFTFLLCIAFPFSVSSQTFFSGFIKEELLKGRVKQIEEFMARFNYEEDWEGKKVKEKSDSLMRAKYIHTLFDYSRFRQKDGKLKPPAEQFIKDAVSHHYLIHYTDTSWRAKVKCKAKVCGKSTTLTLYLRIQQVAPYEYRWVVSDAESPLFKNTKGSIPPLKISPVEHELGFTGLLSLSSPNLQITLIEDVRYIFLNIPGYSFTVERIERKNSYNTGWLITSLTSQ